MVKEEYAIVLDFLPHGHSGDRRPSHLKSAVAQALGEEKFSLLELVPKKEIFLQPHERVYIGEGKREKIHHIASKVSLEKLTPTARAELDYVVKELIKKNEQKYVDFFNNAQPLSMRMHMLELLPGLGKKHMWMVIEEREKEPFKSFEDIKKRVKLMPDPEKVIFNRIMLELEGREKHRIFTE